MILMLPLSPTSWLMGIEIFALILILPAVLYEAGHVLLRPYPRLFNALHWLFGVYMAYVVVAGVATLVMS
jgi:hypothetical protein